MADRIQLNSLHYMTINGQPQLVDCGSIIDVPSAGAFPSATKLAEAAGTLVNNKPTPVRGIRTR